MAIDDLYERDFYVWTQEQAAALRAAAKAGGRSNAVEWDLLAEEVEDLGKRERIETSRAVREIIECFFKLAWSTREEAKGDWRVTIVRLQGDLDDLVTPSLRAYLIAELEALHASALRIARARMQADEPNTPRDEALRWTLEEALGE